MSSGLTMEQCRKEGETPKEHKLMFKKQPSGTFISASRCASPVSFNQVSHYRTVSKVEKAATDETLKMGVWKSKK